EMVEKNSLNRLIRCVCGKKIGPDPRNFNQRVSLGRNDLLIRTFLSKQRSMVAAAKLERDKALWDVQQTTIVSPVNAKVFDIIYRAGERPSAGKPIISLLPPENIKVRFFIPEAKLGKFKIGSKVKLICDGCAEPIAGVINYISPEAEFTPPVIYSTKRREKLIFMAEAIPALQQAGRMKIGQPFDVVIIGDE
ncbi:HlyD family secretion protein, partial [Klebsiella pneumoniae]|uniref:HlyD family secretion protein n=1 Tax=Klebsiella pneumoniae TaxID=573 RepID=UPI0021CC2A2F